MNDFNIKVREEGDIIILETSGYLNNFGGDLVSKSGASEEGMVIDFSDIKKISNQFIQEKLDHAFMVWEKDEELTRFFKQSKGNKPVIVPFTPTAENIAAYIFNKLQDKFLDVYKTGLHLHSVKLWETPTSYALYGQ